MKARVLALVLCAPLAVFAGDDLLKDVDKTANASAKSLIEKKKVKLPDGDVTNEALAAAIQDQTGVNVVVDPDVANAKIAMKSAEPVNAKLLLDVMNGATWEVWRGAVFITSKAKPKKAPPAPVLSDAAKDKWAKQRITLNFADTPLPEVCSFLKDMAAFSITAPDALKDVKVKLKVQGLTVGQVVELICRAHGLKVEKAGDGQTFAKAS